MKFSTEPTLLIFPQMKINVYLIQLAVRGRGRPSADPARGPIRAAAATATRQAKRRAQLRRNPTPSLREVRE